MSGHAIRRAVTRICLGVTLMLLPTSVAWSATYRVIRSFSHNSATPSSGLVLDQKGNAYGTTAAGGFLGGQAGTVYQFSPTSGYHVIYAFSGPDGLVPQGNLFIDAAGNLYGTTVYGGTHKGCNGLGCGTVFRLSPPANGGTWTETVLYSFTGGDDGGNPRAGVILHSDGNLYGTTESGGNQRCPGQPGCGVVFSIQPSQSGWIETVLHAFSANDGGLPQCTLVFDPAGNMYGTAGYPFELSPDGNGGWVFSIVYRFDPTNGDPAGAATGVILDSSGNLYGTSPFGGSFNRGTVFKLTFQDGQWTDSILHSFAGGNDGAKPQAGVVLDNEGNVYGTTFEGGMVQEACLAGCGTVFELSPGINDKWTERGFRFPGDAKLGAQPAASLLRDDFGNIYGTGTRGGSELEGVIFRIKS